ncbi:MAG: hypothetical protein ABJA62_07660, partial [Luteimonas sp.]
MATRKEGPYVLKIPYVADGHPHQFQVNCDVIGSPVIGAEPADVQMKTRGGSPVTLVTASADLWAVVRAYLSNLVTAITYELFAVHPTNGIHSFVSGGTLAQPNGGKPAATNPAQQATFTFRTGAAHIMKLELLDVYVTANTRSPLGGGGIPETAALKTYILSGANICSGRDR